ncbi:DUF7133 domain-containing protein [Lacipirellula sp.]|uniref:DUF7133 domain-containing protein n=1 Tax=Lacipirellula sp. TaxID=2691419 RepID=UPI003D0D2109
MRYAALLSFFYCITCATGAFSQSLVAETQPLTAQEQLKKFHLPAGFEIQLVAQEPEIHKPMNMKFDARGRLWVSHSLEYPFPAANDEAARDAISILSSFSAAGTAQKIQQFADHLDIPIGLLPLGESEALAWSIPNIYRFVDSNGDGVADQRSIAFGPFGITDTHGNQNAFTRWIDGWVYANHGFNNDSSVKIGGQGEEVLRLQSGNTYRFRADGSAIEQYSWGQVNPFGLSFDPLGNLYSADCHSSAVSMLLRGGYYQSFGKPHDGLGYAPVMTNLDHGGTGIAGVVYSTLPDFPRKYRDVLFVGNVITNRVHCDRLKWSGSTPVVDKVEDFLTCDDPWFRPVDIQAGSDGALYVADFYNCIIGHYEVPLQHPKRDRERGRIWRIVYVGDKAATSPNAIQPAPDLQILDAEVLFSFLGHANLTTRVLATNRLVDEFPQQAGAMASKLLSGFAQAAAQGDNDSLDHAAHQASHAVCILQRTDGIPEGIAEGLLHSGVPREVQVHLAKALGETADWQPWHFQAVRRTLENTDPFVRRAGAEALAKHPDAQNLAPLLSLLNTTDPEDAQLYHQTRIAIRNQIASPAIANDLLNLQLSAAEREQLVAFAVTAPKGPAAILIFDEALDGRSDDDALLNALPTAAEYVDTDRIAAMLDHVEQRFASKPASRLMALEALAKASVRRGVPLSAPVREAMAALLKPVLSGNAALEWHNAPLDGQAATPSPWERQQRPTNQGGLLDMISSLAGQGERGGGVLRSPEFQLSARIHFWMCGHDGLPNEPDRRLNYARLVLADGTEIARSYPPRNDLAQSYEWDVQSHEGNWGRIEVVDGMTDRDGFAWLAVSNFEPAAAALPRGAVESQENARLRLIDLVGQLKLDPLQEHIQVLATSATENAPVRLAAAKALVALDAKLAVAPLSAVLADSNLPMAARVAAAEQLGQVDSDEARRQLLAALPSAPQSLATTIAASIAARAESAEAFLQMIEEGKASASLLLEPLVVERLRSRNVHDVNDRIARLTADLETADSQKANLIAERRAAYSAGKFDPEQGRAVFAKSICASCHRIGDVGSNVGPALDGIGNRGLDRLLEDTLDPNRNVDPAFRTVTILTDEGQVFGGFGVREEGKELVFNDAEGKEHRVPVDQVVERMSTALSPMPNNVADQIPPDDYYALLAYLLSLKQQ